MYERNEILDTLVFKDLKKEIQNIFILNESKKESFRKFFTIKIMQNSIMLSNFSHIENMFESFTILSI